ncbi:MAG: PDZ domain-containing protein [Planctomycetes bacterium]|nr:PDZ domain-containing protein [Planctomycetota bacterium]
MKRFVLVGSCLAALTLAVSFRLAAEDGAPSPRDIESRIQELGSSDAKVRDSATEKLRKMGEAAVPALRDAAKSDDAEVSTRARQLLAEVERKTDAPSEEAEQPRPGRRRALSPFGQGFSITFGGPSSVQIQQDANGHLRVSVTEEKDGKSVTETYEADSAEQFREKFPEIAKKYGLEKGARGRLPRLGFRFFNPADPDPFGGQGGPFNQELERQIRNQMKGLERELQEMLKQLGGAGGGAIRRFGRIDQQPREEAQGEEGGLKEEEDDDADDEEPLTEPDPEAKAPAAPKATKPADLKPAPAAAPAAGRPNRELGVVAEYIDAPLRAQLGLQGEEGVLVSEIKSGSPAEKAGLARYDVILKVGGAPVTTQWEFRRLVQPKLASGRSFTLDLIRGGKPLAVTVKGVDAEENPNGKEK